MPQPLHCMGIYILLFWRLSLVVEGCAPSPVFVQHNLFTKQPILKLELEDIYFIHILSVILLIGSPS